MLALERTLFKTWHLLFDIKLELAECVFLLTMVYTAVFGIFTLIERVHFRVLVGKKIFVLGYSCFSYFSIVWADTVF